MASEDTAFDQSAQEKWFAPLADALTRFAREHNLLIEKYYKERTAWDLRFNHPQGGQATITVYGGADHGASIGSSWHVDDFERFTRSIHSRQLRKVAKDPAVVAEELLEELRAITSVRPGQWSQVATGFQAVWGQHSREELEKFAPRYPDPIL